jgi:hypothetical protein
VNLGPGLLSMSLQISIDFLSWNVYFSMRLLVLISVDDFLMFGFALFFFSFSYVFPYDINFLVFWFTF